MSSILYQFIPSGSSRNGTADIDTASHSSAGSSGLKREKEEISKDSLPPAKKIRLDLSDEISPQDFVSNAFRVNGFPTEITPTTSCNHFVEPTQEEIEAYDTDVLQAARDRDIQCLRKMHKEGRTMQCCNRFGESLVHLACRRGFTDLFEFLVKEANVSLCIKDDFGRTPMHDCCWAPQPNFEIMEILLQEVPEHLFLSDVRGHTPFSYVRKHHWGEWVSFLAKRSTMLRPKQVAR